MSQLGRTDLCSEVLTLRASGGRVWRTAGLLKEAYSPTPATSRRLCIVHLPPRAYKGGILPRERNL